ncbi:DUF2726 domain-containing protein [Sphingobium algorifonticola]|uniref:DUF2726 domain-containing protein n=2 Tax=Sphingobium algorifonticola TaxID=2008318 RepID=A0A437J332_9SPHN|nr:DUF2726 domain-containing protein [Sphingobium algorifonticola]
MNMSELFASLLLVGGLVVLGWSKILGKSALPRSQIPLAPVAKPFMTQREQAMLAVLEHVLPMYRIHAQVAMGALLKVSSVPGRRVTPADWNPFARKIVDFVVEDPTTGRVVALIEIDDRSHDDEKDRQRDKMTAQAGYLTLRIPAGTRPAVQSVLGVVGVLRENTTSAAYQG